MDGRVKMYRSNYNPTSDAVWLAALPSVIPNTVLDVGVGTGGILMCLHHHFPNARYSGVDNSQEMLDVCRENAFLNRFSVSLMNEDVMTWSTPLTFDLVVSNPPYFSGTTRNKQPNVHHNVDLAHWIRRCVARVKPRGYFCVIIDAARLAEVITVMGKANFGDITVIPLFGSKPVAERVLIRGRACSGGPSIIHIGFPMNYDPILRDGLTIKKILSNINPQC